MNRLKPRYFRQAMFAAGLGFAAVCFLACGSHHSSTPTYTITASAGSHGTISPLGSVSVQQGGSVTFTLAPSAGYDLESLTVDGSSQTLATTYTFSNVQAGHTIGCTFKPRTLIINEIGSTYDDPDTGIMASRWFEVYNPSAQAQQLSDYTLRCQAATKPGVLPSSTIATYDFSLPAMSIPVGGYAVVRGINYDLTQVNGTALAVVDNTDHTLMPTWNAHGYIELLKGGATAAFVKFGNSTTTPTTATAWSGAAATALPYSSTTFGQSLSRDASSTDTQSAADWQVKTCATYGGKNDVSSGTSSDGDGIPDVSKVSGSTFAGLPLYSWGARSGQRDLFIHVDYMDSTDPGVTPRKEALDQVVAAFQPHGIAVHFDAGNLFSSTVDPTNYNLDGLSHKVTYYPGIGLPMDGAMDAGIVNLYDYKAQSMPIAKKGIFHYLLFANSQNADGSIGYSGIAELPGNDFLVTLGHCGFNTSTDAATNLLIHSQAATIMHELGHNLGLHHGGNTDTNYKPNYFSIMNYLYQLEGLPPLTHAEDRYYYWRAGRINGATFAAQYPAYVDESFLQDNPASNSFHMDYSDGSGGTLNESNVDETVGVARTGSAAIDFNGNGLSSNTGYSYDINQDGTVDTAYSDFDDWSNLQLQFTRLPYGENNGAIYLKNQPTVRMPMSDDGFAVIIETSVPILLQRH